MFVTVRRGVQTPYELRRQDTHECSRMSNMTLGVKWSQVPILSARPETGSDCGDPHQAHGTGGPFWDQYANAYANQDLPATETMAVFETFPQKPCAEVFRLE